MNIDNKNSCGFQKIERIEEPSKKIELEEIMEISIKENASDIHLQVGLPPILRISKQLIMINTEPLNFQDIKVILGKLTTPQQMTFFMENLDIDFSFNYCEKARFRVNLFSEKESFGAALRKIPHDIPSIEKLGLPEPVINFSNLNRGFVLITGPAGQGKSTTLAALIEKINRERSAHIITIEDPMEYVFKNKKSIIIQREIGANTKSFTVALRAVLREDPDIILIGEMRDHETIAAALIAAETGHLVLATLHTNSAAQSIDRIIGVFPPDQQQQIRGQLASVISGIATQQLLKRSDTSGVILATEILISTPAIRNLIREDKTFQIQSILETASLMGMISMDQAIKELYFDGKISKETALNHAYNEIELRKILSEDKIISF
jgi:twitching motility protein PilT